MFDVIAAAANIVREHRAKLAEAARRSHVLYRAEGRMAIQGKPTNVRTLFSQARSACTVFDIVCETGEVVTLRWYARARWAELLINTTSIIFAKARLYNGEWIVTEAHIPRTPNDIFESQDRP
jgi:hypothetical protein